MNKQDKETLFKYRHLARIVIEAVTPLSISTGEKNSITNSVIATDANGLPYIPGTTLAGIIRHTLDIKTANNLFGFQETEEERKAREKAGKAKSEDKSKGSEIIFSDAKMIDNEGYVKDGIQEIKWENDFSKHFKNLPIRQHVRINDKGTAEKRGKFDEQIIYKGTRFCFEMELLSKSLDFLPQETSEKWKPEKSNSDKLTSFDTLLIQLQSNVLRIGGGSRSGFGEINIINELSKKVVIDLTDKHQRNMYLDKTSNLTDTAFWDNNTLQTSLPTKQTAVGWTKYELDLVPEDFFLFSSGFGNEDADITPVTEACIHWDEEHHGKFELNNILIPATSIKGALAHRVAFYWNKNEKRFAFNNKEEENKYDKNKNTHPLVGKENPAVLALFGSEGTQENENEKKTKGNVIISDLITTPINEKEVKTFNHVAIDRFTGGAMAGALFNEQVTYGNKKEIPTLTILLETDKEAHDDNILLALEQSLFDIASGLLPLGGGTNRGHGIFTGTVKRNENLIFKA